MLVALKIPLTAEESTDLPSDVGRANYAEVLNQFNRIDGRLARLAHDGNGPKPLTCSSLLDVRPRSRTMRVDAGQTYTLRVTGLTAPISEGLLNIFVASPPAIWRIHNCSFSVGTAICDAQRDPWTGTATYEALAVQPLASQESRDHITFVFDSPASFKVAGRHTPLPLPELVFGSLADRWNEFSPVLPSPGMRNFGHELLGISDYQLRAQRVVTKDDGLVIGGLGFITYKCFTADRDWLAQVHTLAEFAVYSGVGVKTALGMGRCRAYLPDWEHGRSERGARTAFNARR